LCLTERQGAGALLGQTKVTIKISVFVSLSSLNKGIGMANLKITENPKEK
jgi:hypothetical protein